MKRYLHPGIGISAFLLCLLLLFAACNKEIPTPPTNGTTPPSVSATVTTIPRDPGSTTLPTVTSTVSTIPPITTPAVPEGSAPVTSLTVPPATTPSTPPVTPPELTTAPPIPPAPPVTEPETQAPASNPFAELKRNAKYVLLYDLTEDKTLYSTGDDQVIYPASTTKLLTILYAMTIVNEDTIFTVGNEISIAPADSSKAKIRKGEQYTFEDMVAALMLPSGNDAAYTLAVTCGRALAEDSNLSAADAVARFMQGLNEYAASLGLTSTHFVTPDGYHDEAHVTTVGDILQIARMAKANPMLSRIMATPTYTVTDLAKGRTMTWENSNFLLKETSKYYYPYATGCKTGFHTPAGACLIATAEKDGRELMVLIFKCTDKNVRFVDAKNFLELGFAETAK